MIFFFFSTDELLFFFFHFFRLRALRLVFVLRLHWRRWTKTEENVSALTPIGSFVLFPAESTGSEDV